MLQCFVASTFESMSRLYLQGFCLYVINRTDAVINIMAFSCILPVYIFFMAYFFYLYFDGLLLYFAVRMTLMNTSLFRLYFTDAICVYMYPEWEQKINT